MRFLGKVVLVLFISVIFGLGSNQAKAEPHDDLIPLLINVKGWTAKAGKGTSLMGSGRGGKSMKMISAGRRYEKAKKHIDVNIMVNSGSPSANQVKEYSMDTPSMSIKTTKVDNFWVNTIFNKKLNAGQVFVSLSKNDDTHALLNLGFVNMSAKEAVAFAKQFKWKVIQSRTEKLL